MDWLINTKNIAFVLPPFNNLQNEIYISNLNVDNIEQITLYEYSVSNPIEQITSIENNEDSSKIFTDFLSYDKTNNEMIIGGWGVNLNNKSDNKVNFYLRLSSDVTSNLYHLNKYESNSLTNHFNNGNVYDNSRFRGVIDTSDLENGEYSIEVIMEYNKDEHFKIDRGSISIKN